MRLSPVMVRTGDIVNAYFHGGKLTTTLLKRQPRGGNGAAVVEDILLQGWETQWDEYGNVATHCWSTAAAADRQASVASREWWSAIPKRSSADPE